MLDVFAHFQFPVDLAVIPAALTPDLSSEFQQRIEQGKQPLGLHQHGYAHLNHQTVGRKCEFGDARDYAQQHFDIAKGRERLTELLGELSQPLFTPPWNRCSQTTVEVLQDLGFKAFSRDSTATPLNNGNLLEIPVHVDWFRKHRGQRINFRQLGQAIARVLESSQRVAIMLHHQRMGPPELERLDELLELLSSHPNVLPVLMEGCCP